MTLSDSDLTAVFCLFEEWTTAEIMWHDRAKDHILRGKKKNITAKSFVQASVGNVKQRKGKGKKGFGTGKKGKGKKGRKGRSRSARSGAVGSGVDAEMHAGLPNGADGAADDDVALRFLGAAENKDDAKDDVDDVQDVNGALNPLTDEQRKERRMFFLPPSTVVADVEHTMLLNTSALPAEVYSLIVDLKPGSLPELFEKKCLSPDWEAKAAKALARGHKRLFLRIESQLRFFLAALFGSKASAGTGGEQDSLIIADSLDLSGFLQPLFLRSWLLGKRTERYIKVVVEPAPKTEVVFAKRAGDAMPSLRKLVLEHLSTAVKSHLNEIRKAQETKKKKFLAKKLLDLIPVSSFDNGGEFVLTNSCVVQHEKVDFFCGFYTALLGSTQEMEGKKKNKKPGAAAGAAAGAAVGQNTDANDAAMQDKGDGEKPESSDEGNKVPDSPKRRRLSSAGDLIKKFEVMRTSSTPASALKQAFTTHFTFRLSRLDVPALFGDHQNFWVPSEPVPPALAEKKRVVALALLTDASWTRVPPAALLKKETYLKKLLVRTRLEGGNGLFTPAEWAEEVSVVLAARATASRAVEPNRHGHSKELVYPLPTKADRVYLAEKKANVEKRCDGQKLRAREKLEQQQKKVGLVVFVCGAGTTICGK